MIQMNQYIGLDLYFTNAENISSAFVVEPEYRFHSLTQARAASVAQIRALVSTQKHVIALKVCTSAPAWQISGQYSYGGQR